MNKNIGCIVIFVILVILMLYILSDVKGPKNQDSVQPDYSSVVKIFPEKYQVTINGLDESGQVIPGGINVWKEKGVSKVLCKLKHNEKVIAIRREDNKVLIKKVDGCEGWITYWFIKELE